jgi:UDP-N-acetyl-D-mannosaminuronic acid dehydrogenase
MSEITNNKVCVVGLGYIGLPTSALLGCNNYIVHGVDIDENAVNTINRGEIHIVEPGLADFVSRAVENKTLVASTIPDFADFFIIAVPTPFYPSTSGANPVPNISYVIDATKAIAPYIKPGNTIILESTSPVGTTEKIKEVLDDLNIDTSNIFIAHCPERVLPGHIMRELVDNDRIVGGLSDGSTKKAADFYKTFVTGDVLTTDAKTAEMAKLTENSFRDVNIAFANELSMICDKSGINVRELISLCNRHPRVDILSPGCGVGGHCIAVDPWFIVDAANGEAKLIETARNVNNHKSEWVIDKVLNKANGLEKILNRKPIVACMGLAFKPNIDDLRESPALQIAKVLNANKDIEVLAVEPNINTIDGLNLVDMHNAINSADLMVFLVAHKEFSLGMIENQIDFCGLKNRQ